MFAGGGKKKHDRTGTEIRARRLDNNTCGATQHTAPAALHWWRGVVADGRWSTRAATRTQWPRSSPAPSLDNRYAIRPLEQRGWRHCAPNHRSLGPPGARLCAQIPRASRLFFPKLLCRDVVYVSVVTCLPAFVVVHFPSSAHVVRRCNVRTIFT